MTDGQIWLALFVGFFAASTLVTTLVGEGPRGLGWLAIPGTASLAVTAYVVMFDPDAQVPIFLLMFFGAASVASAIGAVTGQAIRKRGR